MTELTLLERMPNMENEDDAKELYSLFCANSGYRMLKYAGIYCKK